MVEALGSRNYGPCPLIPALIVPHWVSFWTGARPDSQDPFVAGDELLAFWKHMGLTAEEIAASQLIIFADGSDVAIDKGETNGNDIRDLHRRFTERAQIGFGWGTNFTNDFIGCSPSQPDSLRALSAICKVMAVNGQSTVKLSGNTGKASGPPDEVAR